MFKWLHDYSIDIDYPIQKVWDFCIEPKNWLKWMEKCESCHYDGELKSGSMVKIKLASRLSQDIYIPVMLKEIRPYDVTLVFKLPLITQENFCTFQEVSSSKTRVSVHVCIKGLFVPVLKSYFSRKMENLKSKEFKRFLEVIERELIPK